MSTDPNTADKQGIYVEVRISPAADTQAYVDGEDAMPILTIVAGAVELTVCPGGVSFGRGDVAAAEAIARAAADYRDRVQALADLDTTDRP